MKVVFIRHLCTPGNEKRQYIGRTDEDLSGYAIAEFRQRQKNRTAGKYPPVQNIICSPLKRCIQTSGLIYPGQKIVTEPLLRECDFGEYERKTYEELKNETAYIRWLESGGMAAFPGGEEQTDFRRRCVDGVLKWAEKLLEEEKESAAFIVHGGTIMAVLSELSEEPHDFYYWQAGNGDGYRAEIVAEEWKKGRKVLRNVNKIQADC